MASKSKKTVQGDVKQSAQKIWLAGLGALATAEEEGSKLFGNLVKKGEGFQKRGQKKARKVQAQVGDTFDDAREVAEATWDKIGGSFDKKVADALNRLGVPSRMEIQKLTKRVEQLTAKVDQLKPKPKSRPRAKAAPSAATRTAKTA